MYKDQLLQYLKHISEIYADLLGPYLEIAICGGSALNLSGLLERPTKDVDIVSPETWPEKFQEAINITTSQFDLKPGWINQGPVDLLRMGLPVGFFERCQKLNFHENLVYLITSRLDQIHFKLYACVDRGGYHLQDLKILNPTTDELVQSAQWSMTHDVSETFFELLKSFLQQNGWGNAASRIKK